MNDLVCLTGAAGFLGREIARRLQGEGFRVRRVGRSPGPFVDLAVDLSDVTAARRAVRGCFALIHAAGFAHRLAASRAGVAEAYRVGNIITARNCVAAAVDEGLASGLLISSAAVYGLQDGVITEASPMLPSDRYGESKKVAEEEAVRVASRSSSFGLTIVRPATVIGPGDPGNISRLIRTIDRQRFVWIGRGENVKSFVARQDVARACLEGILSPPRGVSTHNISTIHASVREIVEMIAYRLGRRLPSWHLPAGPILAVLQNRIWRRVETRSASALRVALEKWTSSIDIRTNHVFGRRNWTPISLEESLGDEIAWYRAGRPLDS